LFYPFLVNGFGFSVKCQNMLAIPARRAIAFPCETLSIYLLGSKNLKIKTPARSDHNLLRSLGQEQFF